MRRQLESLTGKSFEVTILLMSCRRTVPEAKHLTLKEMFVAPSQKPLLRFTGAGIYFSQDVRPPLKTKHVQLVYQSCNNSIMR
jgi:hypothetical protein